MKFSEIINHQDKLKPAEISWCPGVSSKVDSECMYHAEHGFNCTLYSGFMYNI